MDSKRCCSKTIIYFFLCVPLARVFNSFELLVNTSKIQSNLFEVIMKSRRFLGSEYKQIRDLFLHSMFALDRCIDWLWEIATQWFVRIANGWKSSLRSNTWKINSKSDNLFAIYHLYKLFIEQTWLKITRNGLYEYFERFWVANCVLSQTKLSNVDVLYHSHFSVKVA